MIPRQEFAPIESTAMSARGTEIRIHTVCNIVCLRKKCTVHRLTSAITTLSRHFGTQAIAIIRSLINRPAFRWTVESWTVDLQRGVLGQILEK